MKRLVIILAFITGTFMLVDGIHVMVKGKFIGPPNPGPWASIFDYLRINVFTLGPLFMLFGLAWLSCMVSLVIEQRRAVTFGLWVSVLTLWYLPVGTLCSLIIFFALLRMRAQTTN